MNRKETGLLSSLTMQSGSITSVLKKRKSRVRARSIPLLSSGNHLFSLPLAGPGIGKKKALYKLFEASRGCDLLCLFTGAWMNVR